jgi:hypothetical protein
MKIKTFGAVTLALTLAASTLLASEIYKWTDENGNVHYSDLPTEDAQRVAIRSRPTDPSRVQAEVQARADMQAQRAEAEANAPQGPTEEELRAEAQDRADKCQMYKERQIQFTQNRRIYRMDDDGERVYYNEEEMAAARARVADLVNEYCN